MIKTRKKSKRNEQRHTKIVQGYRILPSTERRVLGWVLESVNGKVQLAYYKQFAREYIVSDMYRKDITSEFENIYSVGKLFRVVDKFSIEVAGKLEGIYVSEEMFDYIQKY